MKKSEDVYKELSKTYTDEEIVDSFIFSVELPKDEQAKANEEFLKLRFERLNSMSQGERVSMNLFALKLRIRQYFEQSKFQDEFSFSKQLRKYIEITGRNNEEIANNLGIHKTKLSRIINDRDNPNIDLMYRLEEHSGGELPAFYWWRLYARGLEQKIRTDYNKKKEQAEKVENPIKKRA
jgi:transcriptional regulator with XRE-family HTH domain